MAAEDSNISVFNIDIELETLRKEFYLQFAKFLSQDIKPYENVLMLLKHY